MNSIKIFFTLVLFFSFGIASQAQIEKTASNNENTTVMTKKLEIKPGQIEADLAIKSNTTTKAESNIITNTEAYVFYFNHKQFMKPVVRKSALC